MRLINCTPHDVVFVGSDGEIVATLPSSGIVPRVFQQEIVPVSGNEIDVDGVKVPFVILRWGDPQDLPPVVPGTCYVVSAITQNACSWRSDLVTVTDMVRDQTGRIIGCRKLSRPGSQ
jgi:hypothetical protein